MRAAVDAGVEPRQKLAVKGGLRDLLFFLGLALLLGGVIFLTVWRRVAFVEVGYEIRSLEGRQVDLLHNRSRMEIERAMLSSPDRIRQAAMDRLGMVEPSPEQIRIVP